MTPRKHRHAEMIRQWLDDDSLEVEYLDDKYGVWFAVDSNRPAWYEKAAYRFRPKMIKCGDMEFPEPMRVAPEVGASCWITKPHIAQGIDLYYWNNSEQGHKWLKQGLLHTTQAAAEAHVKALIALTEVNG